MPNFKLDISYEGTNFFGWQIQKNDRSVQGDITYALSKILSSENINLIGSGRTDSGVHANQQIANFKFDTSIKPKDIKNAINSHLKNDVYINSCECVSDTFNSRFDAVSREYKYVLSNFYSPINRNQLWYIKDIDFNLKKLNEMASIILGEHDFSTFCKQTSLKENNKCEITYSKWKAKKNKLYYNIKGNRFLHHMVRFLVGTMIDISNKKKHALYFQKLFLERNICNSIIKAPAQGLYLDKVIYE
tara:strand:+ start:7 stop:744 length:738 start_codon:yes stop_codon:yes gene_type:complete